MKRKREAPKSPAETWSDKFWEQALSRKDCEALHAQGRLSSMVLVREQGITPLQSSSGLYRLMAPKGCLLMLMPLSVMEHFWKLRGSASPADCRRAFEALCALYERNRPFLHPCANKGCDRLVVVEPNTSRVDPFSPVVYCTPSCRRRTESFLRSMRQAIEQASSEALMNQKLDGDLSDLDLSSEESRP